MSELSIADLLTVMERLSKRLADEYRNTLSAHGDQAKRLRQLEQELTACARSADFFRRSR